MQQRPSCPAGLQNLEVSSWCSDAATSGMLRSRTSSPVSQGRSFPVERGPQGHPAPPPLGCWGQPPSPWGSWPALAFFRHSSSSCPLPQARPSRQCSSISQTPNPALIPAAAGAQQSTASHGTGPGHAWCHQPGSGARVRQAPHSHLPKGAGESSSLPPSRLLSFRHQSVLESGPSCHLLRARRHFEGQQHL